MVSARDAIFVPDCAPAGAVGRRDVAVFDEGRVEETPLFAFGAQPLGVGRAEKLVEVGVVDAAAGMGV